jgi:hypothetical protein
MLIVGFKKISGIIDFLQIFDLEQFFVKEMLLFLYKALNFIKYAIASYDLSFNKVIG